MGQRGEWAEVSLHSKSGWLETLAPCPHSTPTPSLSVVESSTGNESSYQLWDSLAYEKEKSEGKNSFVLHLPLFKSQVWLVWWQGRPRRLLVDCKLNLSKHFRTANKAHLKLALIDTSLMSRASEVTIPTPHPHWSEHLEGVCSVLSTMLSFHAGPWQLESVYPRGRWRKWGKGIQSNVIWRTNEGMGRLREQDKCLEISEELLSGGVRLTHGLQKAKTGACGTQEM